MILLFIALLLLFLVLYHCYRSTTSTLLLCCSAVTYCYISCSSPFLGIIFCIIWPFTIAARSCAPLYHYYACCSYGVVVSLHTTTIVFYYSIVAVIVLQFFHLLYITMVVSCSIRAALSSLLVLLYSLYCILWHCGYHITASCILYWYSIVLPHQHCLV